VNAVAISRRRSRLDRHQSHCVCPFLLDTTSAGQFAQDPGPEKFPAGAMPLKLLLIGKDGKACQCFPAIPSKAWNAF
jgi:hypothetical protein